MRVVCVVCLDCVVSAALFFSGGLQGGAILLSENKLFKLQGLDGGYHNSFTSSESSSDVFCQLLGNIVNLVAANNRLVTVGEIASMRVFAGLRFVDLCSNSLSSLEGLEVLKSLERLRVADNHLSSLDPLAHCSNLQEVCALNCLCCNHCPLFALFLVAWFLMLCCCVLQLNVCNNNLSAVSFGPLRGNHRLTKLEADGNLVRGVQLSACKSWPPNLRVLSLIDNDIEGLEGLVHLAALENLAELDISHNPVRARLVYLLLLSFCSLSLSLSLSVILFSVSYLPYLYVVAVW